MIENRFKASIIVTGHRLFLNRTRREWRALVLGADVVVLVWEGLSRTFGVDSKRQVILSFHRAFFAITLVNWRLYWICGCRDMLSATTALARSLKMDYSRKSSGHGCRDCCRHGMCSVCEAGGTPVAATLALHEKFKEHQFLSSSSSCVITAAWLLGHVANYWTCSIIISSRNHHGPNNGDFRSFYQLNKIDSMKPIYEKSFCR